MESSLFLQISQEFQSLSGGDGLAVMTLSARDIGILEFNKKNNFF
jgi:hypothetical protein